MPLAPPPRLLPVDFRQKFRRWGLRMNSKDWGAYEAGKRNMRYMNLSPDDYEMGIKTLLEWLKL